MDSIRFDLVDGWNRHRKVGKLSPCFRPRFGAFHSWGHTTSTHGTLLHSLLTALTREDGGRGSHMTISSALTRSRQPLHPVGDGPPDLIWRIFLDEMDS